ncbi:TPA: 50S ribosomal protein L14, partial [Candidatus Bathyarchaeota archaeon]|nr:50S ribosomal protein L14 [Candidatus Bathyarchaeota archaeon]
AIIVRQRKPYRRPDGTWIRFEDNAAIIVDPGGEPKGSVIRGPIALEAVKRWPAIASIAGMVV